MGKIGRRAFAAGVILVAPGAAFAHSTAIYVSTPISPPVGHLWIRWAFLGVIFAIAAIAAFLARRRRAMLGVLWSLVLVSVFTLVFYGAGVGATAACTAPLPGLGPASRVFRGLGWRHVGSFFVFWNVLGLLILAVLSFPAAGLLGLRAIKHKLMFLAATTIVYLGFLLPYVWMGAITHGWTGSYVDMDCASQLTVLGTGLRDYAKDHQGKLPTGDTMEEVFQDIRPYLGRWDNWRGGPIYKCSLASDYERAPMPYVWNREMRGRALAELPGIAPPVPIISCPYQHPWRLRIVLSSSDISEEHVTPLLRGYYGIPDEQREQLRERVSKSLWKAGGEFIPRWDEKDFAP